MHKQNKKKYVRILDDDDNFDEAKITQKRLNSITDESEDLQMTFYWLVFTIGGRRWFKAGMQEAMDLEFKSDQ